MLCSLLSQEVLFGLAIINKQSEKRCADQKRTENASWEQQTVLSRMPQDANSLINCTK